MISSQNNVRKYRTKGHEQVLRQLFQCVFSVIHHARPPLGPRETLLSPLVCIGPREAAGQLKKAVILSLPHCASLRHGHWRISLLQSEAECFHNDNDHLRPWSRTVTLGQETLNTPAYVQVRPLKLLLDKISPKVRKSAIK